MSRTVTPTPQEGDPDPPGPITTPTVRGVLIDVDGPLRLNGAAVPGAAETLLGLTTTRIPWALLSNTTRVTAPQLADELRSYGLPVLDEQVVTVATLLSDHLAAAHPGARVRYLGEGDPLACFPHVTVVDKSPDVVIVGGNGPSVTFDRVNDALRDVRNGAALIALHRNTTWATPGGLSLDIGPLVRGIEEASGVNAVVLGKPAPEAFRLAAARAGIALLGSAMVGDDLKSDVLAAQALGMRGVLTLTGKTTRQDVARSPEAPFAVLDSIADLPSILARLALGGS